MDDESEGLRDTSTAQYLPKFCELGEWCGQVGRLIFLCVDVHFYSVIDVRNTEECHHSEGDHGLGTHRLLAFVLILSLVFLWWHWGCSILLKCSLVDQKG